MSKQLAHLVLIISLVGQFLLTPAMAMPSLLHAFSHTQMVTMDHHSSKMTDRLSTPQQSAQLDNMLPQSNTPLDISSGEQSCDMMMPNMQMSDNAGAVIDCDALCEMMSSGECASHCASATGILIQAKFALALPESSAPIRTGSWSKQTAEPAPFTPPPIQTV
ncbi:MAG: hypothetical protein ACI90A_001035 [Shewanella sp.]|jgi:hypothetical protein